MPQNSIRFVTIFGSIAISGIIIVQVYWIRHAWNTNERQFNQGVHVALRSVAEDISRFNNIDLPNPHPVNQLSSNYFVVDINSEISPNVLEHFLITEFKKANLNIDFEYAVYDCSTDKMVYGNYINAGTPDGIDKQSRLPKFHDFVYYFGVRFPSKTGYIISEMTLWIVFSSISLIAVAFFAYSLLIILQQKRLSELQKDFINNMTHEFKTPISTINISSDVILNPEIVNNPQRLIKYGNIIKEQNNRLNTHVEKVLQIARIEKQGLKLNKENINLHELIDDISKSIMIKNKDKTGEMHTELQASDCIVDADRLHLTNVLYNIIDNALKYSKETFYVKISTRNINDSVEIETEDKGIGISKEYQSKIFNKFFRVPTGNIHDVKGFGLGLYYVKNICKAHKWKISFESEQNKRTTFIIKIPRA